MIDLEHATLQQIKNGYRFDQESGQYHCLYCQARFEDGLIYPLDQFYCTAARAVVHHVCTAHGSSFDQLLKLDKRFIGLTDNQKNLLRLIRAGKSNQEIAGITGNAASTIRAQRFLFKEKSRQAKLTVALFELLEEVSDD